MHLVDCLWSTGFVRISTGGGQLIGRLLIASIS